MGQACQNCLGETPVTVQEELSEGAKRNALLGQATTASTSASDTDGYSMGAIQTSHASL